MCSKSYNLSIVQHYDLVRLHDGRRTLRYDKYRHLPVHMCDGFPKRRVRREIKRGCAVVHNENLRLLHERTRNRKALSLSARKVSAALLDLIGKSAFLGIHKLPCLCSLKRLIHLLVRGVRIAPA